MSSLYFFSSSFKVLISSAIALIFFIIADSLRNTCRHREREREFLYSSSSYPLPHSLLVYLISSLLFVQTINNSNTLPSPLPSLPLSPLPLPPPLSSLPTSPSPLPPSPLPSLSLSPPSLPLPLPSLPLPHLQC